MWDFVRFPFAALWVALLNQEARETEYMLERGVYDLAAIHNREMTLLEVGGGYATTVRKLLLEEASQEQRDALKRAHDRLKAARRAAAAAYQFRREQAEKQAQIDPQKLADLDRERRERARELGESVGDASLETGT